MGYRYFNVDKKLQNYLYNDYHSESAQVDSITAGDFVAVSGTATDPIVALDVDFETVISMASKIAAKALGISDTVGTLEKGMFADIAVLKEPVEGRKIGAIHDVYKRGKKMVENGNLVVSGQESFGTLNSLQ
jgi:N-acetylglucosamine-6-phosphate deacetylase